MKALHIVSWRLAAVVAVGLGLAAPLTGQSVPAPADTDTVVHVLNRLGFGPRPGDIERVTQMGVDAYIEQQLHPERIVDPALAERLTQFPTISLTTAEIARDYYGPAEALRRAAQQAAARAPQPAAMADDQMMMGQPARPAAANQQSPELRAARQKEQQILQDLMQARVVRAIHSERQLEEMLVDFWFNHFNVFVGKGQVRVYLTEYERDAIRPHVLGNFRDMLGAVAESPAMLFYLDNFQNVDPKAAQRQVDQQLARQRQAAGRGRGGMQRTQNPQQLEQQQQRMLQARNRGLNENYARELMELHTIGVDAGYTQDDVIAVARAFTGWTIDRPRDGGGTFQFNAAMHDNDPKVVLGTPIKGGGKKDGEAVLDLLASHPATATFIATKLARRFVADEPPASVVERAAKTFLEAKGDLREVTRVIVTSPEFFSAEARRAKVKNPFEFVVSAIRVSGANATGVQPLIQVLQQALGMPLYGAQPPTGWGDTAEDWVNTGALLARLNFALQLASGQLRGSRINVRALAPNTSAESRDRVTTQLIAGGVSAVTSDTLAKAESPQHLVALALGSPEFQRK